MAITADICILDIREDGGGLCTVRFICWLQVANPYPAPGTLSQYPDIASDPTVGPGGQNIPSALTSGAVVEEVYTIVAPSSLVTGATWTTIVEPYLLAVLNARKNYKAGAGAAPPATGLKYKILHDSAVGWSA
jgi:hypothetical protein